MLFFEWVVEILCIWLSRSLLVCNDFTLLTLDPSYYSYLWFEICLNSFEFVSNQFESTWILLNSIRIRLNSNDFFAIFENYRTFRSSDCNYDHLERLLLNEDWRRYLDKIMISQQDITRHDYQHFCSGLENDEKVSFLEICEILTDI